MSMFNDYQYEASKTFKPTKQLTPEQVRLLDWSTGLGGESGEVLDIVKHGIFHGEEFNKMELAKELGDVLWYVSAIATTCDIDLGDVAALNRATSKASADISTAVARAFFTNFNIEIHIAPLPAPKSANVTSPPIERRYSPTTSVKISVSGRGIKTFSLTAKASPINSRVPIR